LTAASTGTPSEWEEPRPDPDRIANFADFVVRMTALLDPQEALEPRNTTKINNTVYTADLTTSAPEVSNGLCKHFDGSED